MILATSAVSRRKWDARPDDGPYHIPRNTVVWVMKAGTTDLMGPYVCMNAQGRILYDPVNREVVEMSPDDLPFTPHSVIDNRLDVDDRRGRRKAELQNLAL